jgi:antirestriction protein ArdC
MLIPMARTTLKSRTTPKVERVERDAAQETVDKIIARLEAGVVPWHKDWVNLGGDLPISLSSLKPYGGTNILVLWIAMLENGWASPYFGTYDEIAERAGLVRTPKKYGKGTYWASPKLPDGTTDPQPRGVRKGQTSTVIVRPVSRTVPEKDDNGNIVLGQDGQPQMRSYHKLVVHHVYNAEQASFPAGCKGVPVPQVLDQKDPIQVAEELVAEYLENGPSLTHGGDRAFYQPATDHIQLPTLAQFSSAEAYHSTKFHEIVHSTGHDSREAREGIRTGSFGAFGDANYSFEELVAELGAAFLCARAGIEQAATLDSSAAYIDHWLNALRADKQLIFKAAREASQAIARITGETTTNNNQEGEEA